MNIQGTPKELVVEMQESSFIDLFNLTDIQHIQDLFADAHGVASIITDTEGKPITKPSNFTRLCENIIRKTEKGCANCFQSDAVIGRHNPSGAIVQTCLNCGLWVAGASITAGGKHIANWLIGQVRNKQVDEQQMMQYADEIGADREDYMAALYEVPVMPVEQFQKTADLLFVFANELSERAYSNILLSRQIAEKEKVHILLLEQEENLSTTLLSIGDGVISTDKNGLVIQMNPVAEKLCGWPLAEATGKPLIEVFNIINNETRNSVSDPVAKVLEQGQIVGLANHTVLVSRNGTEYQIADSAAPIMNKDGEITGVVLVFSDVTEKYAAQKQIKDSEERYRSLLNNLEAGIVVHAPDTSIVMNNARASELLGLSNDQMKGKASVDPAWKFIHEDNTPLTLDEYPINRIAIGRQPINNQVLGIHQPCKNEIVWVTVNGFPVLDTRGEITEVVISFIDITARIEAEEKIKLSEEKFSKSFFNSPDSIIINRLDDGKIVTVNNGFRKIMGYEEAEVIGKTTTELNFYKNPEERNAIINALKTTGQALDIECWFITKHGVEKLGLLSASIIDINGVKHIMSASRDLTDRRLAEEALKVSESRFRGFFDHSPLGINLFDLKGKVIAVNSVARKYFGVSESDPLSDYCLFDDPSVSDEIKQKIKQGQIALEERFIDFKAIRETGMYTSSKDETNKIFISLTYAAYGPYNENPTGIIVLIQDITDRKLAEEKLRKSEEQNKAIVLSTPDHIIIQDKDLKYTLVVNPQMGLTEQDMLGKTDYDFLTKKDADNLTLAKTRVIETGEPFHFETSLISATGKEEFFDGTYIPIFDVHAETNGLIGYFRNVTERKQSELILQEKTEKIEAQNEEYQQINEELNQTIQELAEAREITKKNEERLKMALKVSNSGAWDWDILNDTFYWSDEFLQLFGLPADTIAGFEVWTKALHPDDVEMASTKIQEAIENHTELLNDYRIILPNSEIRWIRSTGHATYLNNKPARLIGLCMDITHQKKAEQELYNAKERAEANEEKYRQSEIDMQEAQRLAHIGSWHWDIHTGVVTWSKELYNINGHNPDIPVPVFAEMASFYTADSWKAINEAVAKVFNTGEPYNLDLEMIKPDGTMIYTNTRGCANYNEAGVMINLHGTVQDISGRKKTEEELIAAMEHAKESDRLKSAFLANMSHEIRTPMNGILGFASLLKEPDLTGEDKQKYIHIIEKSGARMLNIINDIVDISKIEAGLMEVNLKKSNINDQIEYIYNFFKPEIEGKGIRLSFKNSLPEKEAFIKTDREKVYAILTNLVKNAIKYTNRGSIDFGYEKKGEYLEFFVKDTGIGIAKNRQKAIFERFIQADIEDPRAMQGAGLGLTISKAYVEMLGGEIKVNSDEGNGSTFCFTIPYNTKKQGLSDIEQVVSAEDIDIQIKKLKILIAEDDETSDFLITSMLKKNNHEVLHTRNGIEVIEVCRKNPDLDLILMDIRMPIINGYEATRQIRQFNNEVIVIAQTAYGLMGDRQKAIDAGCNEYLSKPIKKDELLRLMQKYFQK